jgi:hypothetical protein
MSAHIHTLTTSSSTFPLIKARRANGRRKKPTVTVHAVRNAPASSWSALIAGTMKVCDRYGLPPVSLDLPQF